MRETKDNEKEGEMDKMRLERRVWEATGVLSKEGHDQVYHF